MYHRRIRDFDELKQLPDPFRKELASAFSLETLRPVEERRSEDGTVKYLSRLEDGETLETVLIPTSTRKTVCISTQVGCAFACAFCASGLNGFQRNLGPGEIVQQVVRVERDLKNNRVTHIVFMGMGEPMANYANLLQAIRILNAQGGLAIGARKITISTVGIVPMIERLSKEGLQLELAISLHAPNDDLRGQIMPVNRRYHVKELVHACRAYVRATKRLITFEYILMDRVNDEPVHAQELAVLLKGLLCKVNLIPCHPIPGLPFKRPSFQRMRAFEKLLKQSNIACTLRKSRGLDIEGACGQLRLQHQESVVKSTHGTTPGHDPRP